MAPDQPGEPTSVEPSGAGEARPQARGSRRPVGYWVKLVDRLIEERLNSLLTEHGVTRRQWQLLNVLLDHDQATRAQLAEALAPFAEAGPTVFSDEVTELVESGWVAQDVETLSMTDRGRTSVARITVVVDRARADIAAGISAEEYAQTLAVLERMAVNLGWTDAGDPTARGVASG